LTDSGAGVKATLELAKNLPTLHLREALMPSISRFRRTFSSNAAFAPTLSTALALTTALPALA
jgi:hypothetical protein